MSLNRPSEETRPSPRRKHQSLLKMCSSLIHNLYIRYNQKATYPYNLLSFVFLVVTSS